MSIKLYSFADVDRSGKIRWTACELGLEVEESRVEFGRHTDEGYRAINPYAQIPAAEIDGRVFYESSAVCRILAERYPEAGLIPDSGADRERFHVLCSVATETLEYVATAYYLSRRGVMDERLAPLLEDTVRFKLGVFAGQLPDNDFLIPGRFTLADIFAGYVLRLGIQGELLAMPDIAAYLQPLMERDAARRSKVFSPIA